MAGRSGSIVNISSICAMVGTPGVHLGYHASKCGIVALTKAPAAQLGPEGIRVNSVHPGSMPPTRSVESVASLGERLRSRIALGRRGEADEVANAVLFLASDDVSYINGAELYVDGGHLAS